MEQENESSDEKEEETHEVKEVDSIDSEEIRIVSPENNKKKNYHKNTENINDTKKGKVH